MATDSETNSKSSTTVVSLNRFSFKLFNQIVQLGGKSKNVFFSPFSVSSLIAMITAGARGSTKQQLVATLSLNQEGSESTKQISDSNCVGAAFKDLIAKISNKNLNSQLIIGSRILITQDSSSAINEQFKTSTKSNFDAVTEEVDFSDSKLVKSVNDWVSSVTNGLIKSIVNDKPNKLTRMLLLNAIYFKARWLRQFDHYETSIEPFANHGDNQRHVNVQMMKMRDSFHHYGETSLADEDVQILELRYQGPCSMFVIVPKKPDGLVAINNNLNHRFQNALGVDNSSNQNTSNVFDELDTKLAELKRTNLDVFLPKFKFETNRDLNSVLIELGIKDAFNDQTADFTGIRNDPGLFVSSCLHKAVIDVTEAGTEAAAVTSIDVVEGPVSRKVLPQVRADHPFMFLIKDNDANVVLFAGQVWELPDSH